MEIKKILNKITPYLTGSIMDIGCGDSPVTENAFTVDGRNLPCVKYVTDDLYSLSSQLSISFDTVVSSHTLEHMPDMYGAIKDWSICLKAGGYLILYLPDGDYYNNKENLEHFHDLKYDSFLFWFKRAFCGEAKNFKGEIYAEPIFEIVESGQDMGDDKYSFYIVAKKI